MKTIQKPIQVQDDAKEAITWLEKEYPKGVELIYVDYSDSYEDATKLQEVLKGDDDTVDWEWQTDSQHDSIGQILENYREEIKADDISDEVRDAMKDWLFEHDTSTPIKDLLKNTRDQLFFINTIDNANQFEGASYEKEYSKQLNKLQKKYARTEAQKKEIAYVLREQFYESPVSFYFYASPLDVFNAIHDNQDKYIVIKGAYFSTIDRGQGSNWLGNEGIFDIFLLKENFIENFFLDNAKGSGYGWGEIAGQSGYDEAGVYSENKKPKGIKQEIIEIETEVTEAQKREAALDKKWRETKICTFGDMNFKRHESAPYRNEYPCGNKCEKCGTFWID